MTQSVSSSESLINDLKKKNKMVEQELQIGASTVKDMSISFPLLVKTKKKESNCSPNSSL